MIKDSEGVETEIDGWFLTFSATLLLFQITYHINFVPNVWSKLFVQSRSMLKQVGSYLSSILCQGVLQFLFKSKRISMASPAIGHFVTYLSSFLHKIFEVLKKIKLDFLFWVQLGFKLKSQTWKGELGSSEEQWKKE